MGFFPTSSRMRSSFTVNPSTARDARVYDAEPRSVTLSITLCAISGSMTLSSKLPFELATVTARSLPITWAATIITASQMTGLILPGMMDEPGWSAGRVISPRPAMGPEFSHLRSLAIFMSAEASVLRAPLSSAEVSCVACAEKWFPVSSKGMPVASARCEMASDAKSAGALIPVPTAVPPRASFARRGSTQSTRSRDSCI